MFVLIAILGVPIETCLCTGQCQRQWLCGEFSQGEEERLNFNCANGMKQYLINYKTGVRLTGSGHGVDMEAMLV